MNDSNIIELNKKPKDERIGFFYFVEEYERFQKNASLCLDGILKCCGWSLGDIKRLKKRYSVDDYYTVFKYMVKYTAAKGEEKKFIEDYLRDLEKTKRIRNTYYLVFNAEESKS